MWALAQSVPYSTLFEQAGRNSPVLETVLHESLCFQEKPISAIQHPDGRLAEWSRKSGVSRLRGSEWP